MLERTDFERKQIVFLFSTQGEKVSFRNDNILITNKNNDVRYQISCYRVFALFVVGETSITTGLIRRAHKFGFVIYLLTQSFKLYAVIGNRMEGNTLLRRQQYAYQQDDIAKFLILNKVLNQRKAINAIRKKTPACKEAISLLDRYMSEIDNVENYRSLLGIEGSSSRVYFSQVFDCARWRGRRPRVKDDWVNATLDIGYSMLFNFIDSLLQLYGFDVYCGVYHREFYMRKSLVCDLVEPFRPLIDLRIRKAINLKEFQEED